VLSGRRLEHFVAHRGGLLLLLSGSMLLASVTLLPGEVRAKTCGSGWTQGVLGIKCTKPGSSSPGGGGGAEPAGSGSGPAARPSCELSGAWTFCRGTEPCLYTPWSPPGQLPTGPRPKGGTPWIRICRNSEQSRLGTTQPMNITSLWRTPAQTAGAEPPLIVQARQAIGTLRIPRVGLAFNPPGRTIVGIDTWWWATGTTARPRHGTSAFGLVATATPTTLTIDPGDDTDPTTCPWTTTKTAAEQSCHTTYTHSSTTGPLTVRDQPAYRATITPTWQITFTNDGTPITFPDLDTTINGPTTTTAVPVYEIQTIVTGTE
jgi:hypothetical protein